MLVLASLRILDQKGASFPTISWRLATVFKGYMNSLTFVFVNSGHFCSLWGGLCKFLNKQVSYYLWKPSLTKISFVSSLSCKLYFRDFLLHLFQLQCRHAPFWIKWTWFEGFGPPTFAETPQGPSSVLAGAKFPRCRACGGWRGAPGPEKHPGCCQPIYQVRRSGNHHVPILRAQIPACQPWYNMTTHWCLC